MTEQRTRPLGSEALDERLRRLESENERLGRELRRFKRKPSRLWGLTLLALGSLSLATGTAYSTLIPAFIGLGLTLWGALLLYIRPVRYVRLELLDSTAPNTLTALRQLVEEIGYGGKGVFTPPRTLSEIGRSTLLIPRSQEPELHVNEITVAKPSTPITVGNPALALTPPGLGLARLIQEELGRDLATADLTYLMNNLPKALIESLEMADDIEIEPSADRILVKLIKPLLPVQNAEKPELEYLPSAIACTLTWATGKPITIESLGVFKDGKTMEAQFHVLEA